MKKLLLGVVSLWLILAPPALAANVNIDGLPAASSVGGTDLYECEQSGTNNKCTPAQLSVYLNALISCDCTVSANVITCTKTNGTAFGALATLTPGSNVATALGIAVGSAGSVVTNGGALGTPSSGSGAHLTALNASNLASGTVAAAIGGAGTVTGALKGSGAGVVTQAACSDLSNGATGCSTAIGTSGATIGLLNAANTWSAAQTFGASDIVLTGGSGCATFTAGVLSSTGSACGGSGSPGGTSGQVQYNNAGSFGGFTVGGDATLNTGTGSLIVTKTNGTAFGALATVTPGTGVAALLAGASSGTGGPAGTTSPVFTTPNLGTPSALVGTNISGTGASFTAGHVTTNANLTGDVTSSGNATTLATVNSNVGSFGSATNCTSVTVNAKGLITAASQTACAPPFSAVTGNATLAQLPTLSANSIYINPTGSTAPPQSIAVPACANDGVHGLVYVNGTGLQCASLTTGGGGTVTSVATGCGISGGPITTTGTITANLVARNTTTTTDTITSSDCGSAVTENNASAVAVAITTSGFASGNYFTVKDLGAGIATYTPSSGTIDGSATLVCKQNQSADLYFDGTNYKTLSNTCGLGALATVTPGTGVAAAAANALSSAGGLTGTIASGTAVLGTTLIASGACATVVTVTATNVATTDTVSFGYNGDPTAVTGYGASATGAVLTVYPYPTANNVNVKVCNSTASSITPGAMTLNWRVVR
jgi:hypothetical protein